MTNMFVFVIIANSGVTVVIVSFMLVVDIIFKWFWSKKTIKIVNKESNNKINQKTNTSQLEIQETTKNQDNLDLSPIDKTRCKELHDVDFYS